MTRTKEEWREITGFPDYQVSSLGRVRRILKGTQTPHGYHRVSLCKDGKTHYFYIHALVAEAFHGQKPSPLHQVAHNDGNGRNNAQENLRWATRSENMQDKVRHGTDNRADRHPLVRLSGRDVLKIRTLLSQGHSPKKLAEQFGVHPNTVRSIRRGASRVHG